MSTKTSYDIEVELPDETTTTIQFTPSVSTFNGKSVYHIELARYLYSKLQKSHNIDPTKYYFRKRELFSNFLAFDQDVTKKEIALPQEGPLKIQCKPYHVTYTSQASYTSKSKICGCGHYKIESPNQIAFAFTNTSGLLWAILCLIPLICVLAAILAVCIIYVDGIDKYGIVTLLICVTFPFWMLFILFWYVYLFLGRKWLVIEMNENDPSKDKMYFKGGWCMDHCWCRREYLPNISELKGIRIEKYKAEKIEDDEGNVLALVFDGDDDKSRKCCDCNKLWVYELICVSRYRIVYYELAKFFRERYGDRDDLRFTIPKSVKDELKNYGINDTLLDGRGGWTEKEWVDLEVAEERVVKDGVDEEAQEIRDLVDFVKKDNENDLVIMRESVIVMNVLDNGVYKDEMVECYQVLKKEYDEIYKEREWLDVVKMAYCKKMLTLMAFKAKEYGGSEEVEEQDGGYTIETRIDKKEDDGIKDSLLGRIN